MVSVIVGIHCHMIMHAFLEIIYKMSIHDCVGYCVFVLAGNISLHDCTIVNTDLPNIVVDVGYSYFLNLNRYPNH